MQLEFDADSPRTDDVIGVGTEHSDSIDSSSDVSSLASWGKHLLTGGDHLKQTNNNNLVVVTPLDTVSTKAVVTSTAPANFPVKFPPPPAPSTVVPVETVAKSSSSSSAGQSTESSKNSTLERFETPESKSSLLERNIQTSRSLSNKTGSLSRDISGISACEQFLYDNAQLAVLERKNSAAAEVIEALTSEIVRNVKLERDAYQRSAEKLLADEPSNFLPPAPVKCVYSLDDASPSPSKKPYKEPDIVASNKVVAPPKPPRRKRCTEVRTVFINFI